MARPRRAMGEAVLLLQRALNLGPTQLPRLAEDASFGPKTHGRVVEFHDLADRTPCQVEIAAGRR